MKEGSKELDVNAIEDPKLLDSVDARMKHLNELTKDRPDDDPADDFDDQDEPTPDDDAQADDSDSDDDSTPDDKDGDQDDDKDGGLPLAYVRAAIHRGWTQDDVDEFQKSNPDAAFRTFQNLYNDVNNASKEWARIGRARQDSDKLKADEERKTTKFEGIDVDALKKEYDLDDNVVAVLKAQNRQMEQLADMQANVPAPTSHVQSDPNIELNVENFFNSEMLKDYAGVYGRLEMGQTWNDLTANQHNTRYKVLEEANRILIGAESMNMNMQPIEALERAHMIVTEPIREQIIRKSIKDKATKRKKGMTLRPSEGSRTKGQTITRDSSKPRSKEELETDVQEKLSRLFN